MQNRGMEVKKKFIKVLSSTIVAAALLGPNVGFAERGPNPTGGTNLSTEAFLNYDELVKKLNQLEQVSKGKVKVEVAGQTNQGRSIHKVTVGHGKKVVLIQSEIHGNEKTGTVALLNILENLGKSNSPDVKKMLDELTIVAIPMMNVDGSELDRRGNEMTWSEVVGKFPQLSNAQPTWNYYTTPRSGDDYASKPGFDVNRDFNPNLNYVPQPQDFPGASEKPGWFITPES